jgi:glycine oxidase
MTQKYNIAILGAGAMGLTTARTLLRRGHTITIFDPKNFPANNASFIAGGMLAPYAEIEHMNKHWIAAGLEGIEFWKQFSNSHNIEFHQRGSLLISHENDRYVMDRFAVHLPADAGYKENVETLEPALPSHFVQGIFIPSEAHLHPAKAMLALCDEITHVTKITQICYPEQIKKEYDFIFDTRGIDANEAGLRGVKGELLIVRNPEFKLSRPVRLMHPRYPLYIIPREGDVFMIGATQIESEDGKHVSLRSAMELMSALYALSPSFGEAQILEIASGIRPAYPDNLPRIRRRGNIISATGMFRHGWLLSPVMAQCLADMIEGRENSFISLFNGDACEIDHQRPRKDVRSAA